MTMDFTFGPGSRVSVERRIDDVTECVVRGDAGWLETIYRCRHGKEFAEEDVATGRARVYKALPLSADVPFLPGIHVALRGGHAGYSRITEVCFTGTDTGPRYICVDGSGHHVEVSHEEIAAELKCVKIPPGKIEVFEWGYAAGGTRHTKRYLFEDGRLNVETGKMKEDDAADGKEYGWRLYARYLDIVRPFLEEDTCMPVPENVFWARAAKYCAGMTMDDILREITEHPAKFMKKAPQKPVPLETPVASVRAPVFERYAGNENKSTFDTVRIEIALLDYPLESLKTYCKKHGKELAETALEKLRKDTRFEKFGVPENFLKIYGMVLTADKRLVVSFCLKSEGKE